MRKGLLDGGDRGRRVSLESGRSRPPTALIWLPGTRLARRLGVHPLDWSMLLFHDHALARHGWRPTSLPHVRAPRRGLTAWSRAHVTAARQRARAAVTLAMVAFASDSLRRWLGVALADVCIIGGIIAAPIVSLAGWLGMALPARAPLHAAAPMLFIVSLVCLGLAFVGAHAEGAHRPPCRP